MITRINDLEEELVVEDAFPKLYRIAVPTLEGITFVSVEKIIFCKADSNYTELIMTDQKKLLVAKSLKQFERILMGSGFFRVHHNAIVNLSHIQKYVRGSGGYVVLTEGHHQDVSRRRKHSFLKTVDYL